MGVVWGTGSRSGVGDWKWEWYGGLEVGVVWGTGSGSGVEDWK